MGDPPDADPDSDPDRDRVAELHAHLAATAELPVERSASRVLGEAEAVAADLHEAELHPRVVRERAAVIGELLSHVDETGHPEADEHVEEARACVATLVDTGEQA